MIARGAVCLNRARTVLRRGGGSNAVRLLHSEASLLVEWDNGQSLNVIHLIDRVEIITLAPPSPDMAGQEKDSVDEHTD